MAWKRSRMAVAALAVAALAMSITAGSASAATPSSVTPFINTVPCNNSAFVHVWWHYEGNSPKSNETCFANGGVFTMPYNSFFNCMAVSYCWLDAFSTGNNKVQWYGDGRWQPSTAVGKWTYYYFPHTPGGVSFAQIKIS